MASWYNRYSSLIIFLCQLQISLPLCKVTEVICVVNLYCVCSSNPVIFTGSTGLLFHMLTLLREYTSRKLSWYKVTASSFIVCGKKIKRKVVSWCSRIVYSLSQCFQLLMDCSLRWSVVKIRFCGKESGTENWISVVS